MNGNDMTESLTSGKIYGLINTHKTSIQLESLLVDVTLPLNSCLLMCK